MEPEFRLARDDDINQAYVVFRRSIFAYLNRIGLASAEEASDPPIASAWLRQESWIRHFWATAAENWVATDGQGGVIGWALSILRDGHLELAFFFVDPACTSAGVGTRLLDLAFGKRPEAARTIMATQDPSALSLYLRRGVHHVGMAVDFCASGQPRPVTEGLEVVPLGKSAVDVGSVCAIERDLLHLNRPEDIGFLLNNRPAWLALRDGKVAGYAFGAQPLPPGATDFPSTVGPIAALETSDIPALLDLVIDSAPRGADLYFSVPMQNRQAIDHLLSLKARIDPFYLAVLSSEDSMRLDRYIHTAPSFIL